MKSWWPADRFDGRRLLGGGPVLLLAIAIVALPAKLRALAVIFVLCGLYVGAEETLQDWLCAELVAESQHGMAIETVATVNGIGHFASSIVVGFLWTFLGTAVGFGYSAVLFACGVWLVWRMRTAVQPAP
jgi:dipeptide/tripeptide permease